MNDVTTASRRRTFLTTTSTSISHSPFFLPKHMDPDIPITPAYNPNPSQDQKALWKAYVHSLVPCASVSVFRLGFMQFNVHHVSEQLQLKQRHILHDDFTFTCDANGQLDGLCYVAGVDLSFPLDNEEDAVACLVVLEYPTLQVRWELLQDSSLNVIYEDFLDVKLSLPYIAGFLAFREVAPLLDLLTKLKNLKPEIYPQIILVDGNGLLHPRLFGLACHLGVLSSTPTIGIAKNFLQIADGASLTMSAVKRHCRAHLAGAGDKYVLRGDSGTVYGAALRMTRDAPNPIFVSQGHRVTLETAVRVAMACAKYRVPEPIRAADGKSREYVRNKYGGGKGKA
ncbi:endonuclease V-domain-containing protein [Jimgerdemannia flammicorona]|uniref:Endonuclease V-domain-containing protein n=1 Tax=Jimgerdemannia flammicorona TaxID=994334 RepID=A0A433DN95_9FUNG|nr:endonuclease V-domain-containing protein [Jimgerdemannia flammicorona]